VHELLTTDALAILVVSFGVGIVVGLTGMGGGALMTPALIFLGVSPTMAVTNDLVAAAVNRPVGALVHLRRGSPNLKLVMWLVIGSVPTAFVGAFLIKALGTTDQQESFLRNAIGAALLVTAVTYAFRMYMQMRYLTGGNVIKFDEVTVKPIPTLLIGLVGGLLVGVTSVGAGSLMMVSLLLLYPTLSAVKLVGTDLMQAVPLVVAAAAGHVIVGGAAWAVLIPLIVGGTPGTYLGARIAHWVSQSVIRRGIVTVLSLTGLTLLGMPPVGVGISGAAMLLLGPLIWGWLRHTRGLPAFDNDLSAWRLPNRGNHDT
jgi:hypothetical protein